MVLAMLALGCESEAPTEVEIEPTPETLSADSPIIAAAPWFEVPEDFESQHAVLSPNAQVEIHFLLLAEQQAQAHPGDGGGRAWLESVEPIGADPATDWAAWRRGEDERDRPALPAASSHRFDVVYEAGPEGIAVGGLIFPSPEVFWEWSPAQNHDPGAEGFVTAEVLDGDARLSPDGSGIGFVVEAASLTPGDRVRFVYGAGPQGARVDRYAERDALISFTVDADGDGYRRWIEGGAVLDIAARRARQLVAHGPAEQAPGQEIVLRIALVDAQGNRTGRLDEGRPPGADGPTGARVEIGGLPGSSLEFGAPRIQSIEAWDDGAAEIVLPAPPGEGVLRLGVRGLGSIDGLAARVPPIVVRESSRRLVWADLHGHTTLSDGTGRPDDYFRYARDVARLDVVSLTDHDHWGPRPLDADPEATRAVFATTDDAERAGRFVTIPGYEWTSWLHGHRHVLYFDPAGAEPRPTIFSALARETDRPDELWDALRGRNALTFAHHSAGDPVAVNWGFRPDPELEPVTEIVSVHGQSESAEMPRPVAGAIPGWFVQDTLRQGYRFGFIGSSDSHDGHPGLAELAAGSSGIAGLFVDRLDRAGVRDALRRRQTFATNGHRPFFEVSIDGVDMGGTLVRDPDESHRLRIRYEATSPIERIELVRSGRVATIEPDDSLSVDIEREIPALRPGEFHYVRVLEENGGNAWSSPIYVDATGGED